MVTPKVEDLQDRPKAPNKGLGGQQTTDNRRGGSRNYGTTDLRNHGGYAELQTTRLQDNESGGSHL